MSGDVQHVAHPDDPGVPGGQLGPGVHPEVEVPVLEFDALPIAFDILAALAFGGLLLTPLGSLLGRLGGLVLGRIGVILLGVLERSLGVVRPSGAVL